LNQLIAKRKSNRRQRENNFYSIANRAKKAVNHFIESDSSESFLIRVNGDSMVGANISHGDLLVCDRLQIENDSIPDDGQIVVCLLNGCPLVKRLKINGFSWELHSENDSYTPLLLKGHDKIEIIGLVRNVIKPT
jgi:DNA polymerase V